MKFDFLDNFSEKDITYFMYGLFLGDGTYKHGRLINVHTNKQRFYVEWQEHLFKYIGLNVQSKYDYIRKTQFGYYEYSHISVEVPKRFYFETLNKCFDDNGKKIVSNYVLNHINEFGLLLWFLDDGQFNVHTSNNKTSRFGYLNTQSFTFEENKMIQRMFKVRFDIDLSIHKDNSGFDKSKVYYRLYFNATNFRKFIDIVRPYIKYIPHEFYYKFNMKYEPNRIKKSQEFSEKYNFM